MDIQSSAGPNPNPNNKDINFLVVYVSPNTTDPKIIEFKDFILSKMNKK